MGCANLQANSFPDIWQFSLAHVRSRHASVSGCLLHYLELGDTGRDTVVIWHGVTGTAYDHFALAQRLASRFRVICPDAPGCGWSDWTEPDRYRVAAMSELAAGFLGEIGARRVSWIGTSKGGMLGIRLAAQLGCERIERLVLNDITPRVPIPFRKAMQRELGNCPKFPNFPAFEAHVRRFIGGTAQVKLSETEWRSLAQGWSRRLPDGSWTFHFDPRVITHAGEDTEDFDNWRAYDRIGCPTLLLKAKLSSVTERRDVLAMTERGPRASVVNLPGVGHAPFLNRPEEQEPILRFLGMDAAMGHKSKCL